MAIPRRERVEGPLAPYAADFFEELSGRAVRFVQLTRTAESHRS